MRTIGFTREYDAIQKEFLDNEKGFDCLFIDEMERKRIIDYLNNSERVYGVTWALYDGENYIGPYMLFSDGEWIWPSHFAYFLKKLNFSQMTREFLDHLRVKEYKIASLSEEQKAKIKFFIYLKLFETDEKAKEMLKQNANALGYNIPEV